METKYKIQAAIIILISIIVMGIGMGLVYRTSSSTKEQWETKRKQEISQIESSFKSQLEQERASSATTVKQLQVDIASKETQYQSTIRELKSKSEIVTIKIIKPDGTIEEKRVEKTQTIDLSSSVQELKKEYEAQFKEKEIYIRQEYERALMEQQQFHSEQLTQQEEEIKVLKETKTTSVDRKFGLGAGILHDGQKYISTSYDAFGPFFIGSTVEQYQDKYRLGLGIGVRF